jgi:hypothetical protein
MRQSWLYGCGGVGSSYRVGDAQFSQDVRIVAVTKLKGLGREGEERGRVGEIKSEYICREYTVYGVYVNKLTEGYSLSAILSCSCRLCRTSTLFMFGGVKRMGRGIIVVGPYILKGLVKPKRHFTKSAEHITSSGRFTQSGKYRISLPYKTPWK